MMLFVARLFHYFSLFSAILSIFVVDSERQLQRAAKTTAKRISQIVKNCAGASFELRR